MIRLDLREAIRLAVRNNQRYLVEGETLQVQLLSLEVLRHSWNPTVEPLTGSIFYTTSPDAPHALGQDATVSLSQKLPFGGACGAAGSRIIQAAAGWPTVISGVAVVLACVVAAATGIVFGTFPAVKAASVDPIVALREE